MSRRATTAPLTAGVRLGLGAADLLHGVVGTGAMKGTLDGLRKASGGRLPKWSPALARPVNFVPKPQAPQRAERVVYFPSCAARSMGAQRGHDGVEMLPTVAERLFQRAGFDVLYPQALAGLCCGQPFESKGLVDAADLKSAELEAVLREASEGGRWPIVFDTSPCAYRMKKFLAGRLNIQDSIEFVHDVLLPRLQHHAAAAAGGRAPGVQRAQDGQHRQADGALPRVAAPRWWRWTRCNAAALPASAASCGPS